MKIKKIAVKRVVAAVPAKGTRTRRPKVDQVTAAPESTSRFTIVGPTMFILAKLAILAQEVLTSTGQRMRLHVEELADQATAPKVATAVPVNGGAARHVSPVVPQIRRVVQSAVRPAAGRNTVVYQVLNGAVPSGDTKQQVHAFLMANQMKGKLCSAREVMDRTHLGQKAVESAIHGLRTEGFIESVATQQVPAANQAPRPGEVVAWE